MGYGPSSSYRSPTPYQAKGFALIDVKVDIIDRLHIRFVEQPALDGKILLKVLYLQKFLTHASFPPSAFASSICLF